MTVWIGWLQWIRGNGFGSPAEPILRKMTGNFQCKDAILDWRQRHRARMAARGLHRRQPAVSRRKIMRRELGDDYMAALFKLWNGRVPREADLCCYWFEKARAHIEAGAASAGLLATQGIRGGANREVLKRIKKSGDIFWAVSDREWRSTARMCMSASPPSTPGWSNPDPRRRTGRRHPPQPPPPPWTSPRLPSSPRISASPSWAPPRAAPSTSTKNKPSPSSTPPILTGVPTPTSWCRG
ncbi:MAG: hypothetical protein U1F77_15070 [Kiritimatiellia bacterium]